MKTPTKKEQKVISKQLFKGYSDMPLNIIRQLNTTIW